MNESRTESVSFSFALVPLRLPYRKDASEYWKLSWPIFHSRCQIFHSSQSESIFRILDQFLVSYTTLLYRERLNNVPFSCLSHYQSIWAFALRSHFSWVCYSILKNAQFIPFYKEREREASNQRFFSNQHARYAESMIGQVPKTFLKFTTPKGRSHQLIT